jgi:hypothetical protein
MRAFKIFVATVFGLGTLSAMGQAPADANTGRPVTEDDIAVLRQDVQTDRIEIITRNMKFTEEEAKAFWPVYREYAHGQQVIGDQRMALIKDYAASFDKIDNAQAASFIARALKYDDESLQLRKSYVEPFTKAIGARQTARFYQVDNRLTLLTNVQLAALLPIIK